ncbi:MAG: nucleoside deaminase [Pelagibacteraceae bacterium]|nr:nucleoside deaminase [Pelagibacteraceae bacterium]MBT3901988.1 nucleoside deaminase [Pelagibacteraceae bacterium]MBT4645535.1 nucleoside deaminase [Pelagibacteraceae bacterium]MBT4951804.1 nucleoside deaminase [Pelagibacteraceae bacterium]MBT5214333.1 nucleoside deaminase [Pelagibacteraceae bacterium]
MSNLKFMNRAIDLSIKNIEDKGGPFGCVITKDSKIIAEGVNKVTINNDPTAHAEIVAIREACKKLNTFNLSGYELYTSCEPCPMCLSAIYWAHIDNIYYGNSREDASKINFDDKFIYEEFKVNMSHRKIPIKRICENDAIKAFKLWEKEENKTKY